MEDGHRLSWNSLRLTGETIPFSNKRQLPIFEEGIN